MKCFIHWEADAIAACKTCGKGMCADCSAYSGHSGICPECRKEELIHARNFLVEENVDLIFDIVKSALWCVFIITIPFKVFRIFRITKKRKLNAERIAILTAEIDRLNNALANRGTNAFI